MVEKPHPLLSSIHLAAPGAIRLFRSVDSEGLYRSGSDQGAEHFRQSRVIEAVVMLAIGLSMAGVVLGNLNSDESV